ncbi:MAG: hypothetical protein FD126_1098 [Elusimicrobia bacterium]|nr:MAG: hypothetical protein FD126_1098 [Elusimicrobiota bacterium]
MSEFAQIVFDAELYQADSVLAAAQVLARRLAVVIKPDGRGGLVARVRPSEGAEALLEEAGAQELRRRVAAANRTLREYVVTRSLLSAGGPAVAPVPEDRRELERLVLEAERSIAQKAARFEEEGLGQAREADPGKAP